jgi:hypothetical protein
MRTDLRIPLMITLGIVLAGCASGPGGRGRPRPGEGQPGMRPREMIADSLGGRPPEPVRTRRPPADLAEALRRARRENRRVLIVWARSGEPRCDDLHHLLTEDPSLAGKVRWEYELIWADLDSLERDPGLEARYREEPPEETARLPLMTVLDGEGILIARGHIAPGSDEGTDLLDTDRRQVFSFLLDHQAPWPDIEAAIKDARKQADRTKRLVFIYFTEPLCDWCEYLADWLERPAVAPVWDRAFVTVRVDVGRSANGNLIWMQMMTGGGRTVRRLGLPWFVITSAGGRVLGNAFLMPDKQNVGFPWTEEEVTAFEGLLDKRAKAITDGERSALMADLRAMHEEMKARGETPPENEPVPPPGVGRGRRIPPR